MTRAGGHRLVFMGSDAIALPLLDWLAGPDSGGVEIAAVFTRPARPAGRGQQLKANPIKEWADLRGIPVQQPERLGEPERAELARLAPDLALVMAYGQILKDAFIATPRLGTVNLHASLLPRYRGASPIQAAIASGDSETGVALMRIVRELDAGPVAASERVPIGPRTTAEELERAIAAACPRLLARVLPQLFAGTLPFVDQDPAAVSYCRKLAKDDGGLDFAEPANVLAARINALHPWPGCSVHVKDVAIKLGLADAVDAQNRADPGTVVGADAHGVTVGTGRGLLRLLRLQRPGGRMLPAPEFLRGFPLEAGTRLPSRPMRPFVAREKFS